MNKLISGCAVLCLLACSAAANAQTVVLQQDVNQDTLESDYGPNRRHYVHRYFGAGFGIGTEDRTWNGKELNDVKYGFGTGIISFGLRYKLRLAEHYALGLDLGYHRQTYNFKQRDDKLVPYPGKVEKERLIFHNLALEAFQRINFGRRGNHLGRYVDLGAYGEWNFDNTLLIKMDQDTGSTIKAERVKIKFKDLRYVNRINYGVSARVGSGRLALYGRYRLSDLFDPKKTANYPELPRLTVGLQVGF